ncbi:hypothetical protein [Streptomonospora salina]|uniref:Uncharacterized protein n=1 Tax=Streptomonospora salina TaxID=104205 RepID=A0A841E677_9ACTN|nr:hypothetical protein [Streptomonospora salina]MBB5999417.1 hypothetical protein [Streptomonospora salina]
MHEQIAALAASASTALVEAMTADGWTALRDRLAPLLGRGDHDGEMRALADLERSSGDIAAASGTGLPAVRAGAQALWRERLRRRLEEDPGLAEELQNLLAEACEYRGSGSYAVQGPAFRGPVKIGGSATGSAVT